MESIHEPSPEFTRFLEWQTRTELRREARFRPVRRRAPILARWTQMAALVLFSVVLGGGAVYAMERLEDSRAVEVLIERNRLETELAERALGFSAESFGNTVEAQEVGAASAAEVVETLEPFLVSTSAALVRAESRVVSKPATATRPSEPEQDQAPAVSTDTIALIERAAAPATIGNRVAAGLLIAVSVVGFGLGFVANLSIGTTTAEVTR